MNYQEIVKVLKELEITSTDLGDEDYDVESLEEKLGDVKEINSVGGHEGGGDYAERVYYFKEHNVYIKITGFYSSYAGTDWEEDFREVFPRQKTITIFE